MRVSKCLRCFNLQDNGLFFFCEADDKVRVDVPLNKRYRKCLKFKERKLFK